MWCLSLSVFDEWTNERMNDLFGWCSSQTPAQQQPVDLWPQMVVWEVNPRSAFDCEKRTSRQCWGWWCLSVQVLIISRPGKWDLKSGASPSNLHDEPWNPSKVLLRFCPMFLRPRKRDLKIGTSPSDLHN